MCVRDGARYLYLTREYGYILPNTRPQRVEYGVSCGICKPQRRRCLIWSSSYDKTAERLCGHGKFDVIVFETFVSIDHFASDAIVAGRVLCRPIPSLAEIEIYFIPDTCKQDSEQLSSYGCKKLSDRRQEGDYNTTQKLILRNMIKKTKWLIDEECMHQKLMVPLFSWCTIGQVTIIEMISFEEL